MLSNLVAFMALLEEFEYHKFYGLTNTMHKSKFKRIKSFCAHSILCYSWYISCLTHKTFCVETWQQVMSGQANLDIFSNKNSK